MKIAIVIPFVYPFEVGGAQVHAYYLAKVLSKENTVTVLSKGNKRVNKKIGNANFVLVESPHKYLVGSIITFFSYFRELSKCQPNVIIVDFLTGGVSEFAVVLSSVLRRVPYVVTIHGHEIKKNDAFSKLVQRIVLFFAKRILVVSNELFDTLIKNFQIFNKKIVVVPNGYDSEEIEQARTKIKNRDKKDKRIAYVGRLCPVKDPLTLIKSLEIVLDGGINAQLSLVGGGSLLAELKRYCHDNLLFPHVAFVGQVDHQTALECIANSDLLVLSSLAEGMPLVLIEAMALGKPVVATRVGGICELVEDRKNGILVEPRSPQQMAIAISEIMTNTAIADSLSSNAYEKAKSFTWEKVCEDYERILQKL